MRNFAVVALFVFNVVMLVTTFAALFGALNAPNLELQVFNVSIMCFGGMFGYLGARKLDELQSRY